MQTFSARLTVNKKTTTMMRRGFTGSVIAASLLMSGSTFAETGNDLQKMFTTPSLEGYALGYLSGVLDSTNYFSAASLAMHGSGLATYCTPDGVTKRQAFDVVKNYVVENPHIRHLNATNLVQQALTKAWPCQKN